MIEPKRNGRPPGPRVSAPPGEKYCAKCKEIKPVSAFYPRKDISDGLSSWCRNCTTIQARTQHAAKGNARSCRRHYGITPEHYQALFEQQSGVCAICGKPERRIHRGVIANLSVDHDHVTGMI